jgi:hypothetical protein
MSTKIYEAFRFRRGKLIQALSFFNQTVEKSVLTTYSSLLYGQKVEEKVAKWREERTPRPDVTEQKLAEIETCFRHIYAQQAIIDHDRENRSIDEVGVMECGFTHYFYKGHVYSLPYAGMLICPPYANLIESAILEAELPDFIKPYFYYNNTDRPADMSRAEWKRREDNWDAIFDNRSPSLRQVIFENSSTHFYRMSKIYDAKYGAKKPNPAPRR